MDPDKSFPTSTVSENEAARTRFLDSMGLGDLPAAAGTPNTKEEKESEGVVLSSQPDEITLPGATIQGSIGNRVLSVKSASTLNRPGTGAEENMSSRNETEKEGNSGEGETSEALPTVASLEEPPPLPDRVEEPAAEEMPPPLEEGERGRGEDSPEEYAPAEAVSGIESGEECGAPAKSGEDSIEAVPQETGENPDEPLQLCCPKCEGELVLLRKHMGVEGACVWCQTKIVAAESAMDGEVRVFPLFQPDVLVQSEESEAEVDEQSQPGNPASDAGVVDEVESDRNVDVMVEGFTASGDDFSALLREEGLPEGGVPDIFSMESAEETAFPQNDFLSSSDPEEGSAIEGWGSPAGLVENEPDEVKTPVEVPDGFSPNPFPPAQEPEESPVPDGFVPDGFDSPANEEKAVPDEPDEPDEPAPPSFASPQSVPESVSPFSGDAPMEPTSAFPAGRQDATAGMSFSSGFGETASDFEAGPGPESPDVSKETTSSGFESGFSIPTSDAEEASAAWGELTGKMSETATTTDSPLSSSSFLPDGSNDSLAAPASPAPAEAEPAFSGIRELPAPETVSEPAEDASPARLDPVPEPGSAESGFAIPASDGDEAFAFCPPTPDPESAADEEGPLPWTNSPDSPEENEAEESDVKEATPSWGQSMPLVPEREDSTPAPVVHGMPPLPEPDPGDLSTLPAEETAAGPKGSGLFAPVKAPAPPETSGELDTESGESCEAGKAPAGTVTPEKAKLKNPGRKGRAPRKGLVILLVIIIGFVCGAAVASFLLPIEDYIARAQTLMNEKFDPASLAPILPGNNGALPGSIETPEAAPVLPSSES